MEVRKIIILFILVFLSRSVFCNSFDLLSVRKWGMGGTGVAMEGDYSTIFSNPAASYFCGRNQFGISYSKLYEDIGFAGLGLIVPTAKLGGFGMGVSMFDYGDFSRRSESGSKIGEFSRMDNTFLVSYAYGIGPVSFGINLKHRQVNLETITKESGVSFDFGVFYKNDLFNLGLSVADPGGWKIGENNIANPEMKAGIAIKPVKSLSIYSDLGFPNYKIAQKYSLGIEWEFVQRYFLRAGVSYQSNLSMLFTAGFRIPIKRMWGFEYSFISNTELGNRHFASIYFEFGKNMELLRKVNLSRKEVKKYQKKIVKKYRIAVLDFDTTDLNIEETLLLSELFRAQIVNTELCLVVERGEVEKILQEHKLGMMGITKEDILEIGKFLPADFIVSCSISRIKGTYYFRAKMLHIQSGEFIAVVNEECADIKNEGYYVTELLANYLAVESYRKLKEKLMYEMQ